jgi:hypothetical protein
VEQATPAEQAPTEALHATAALHALTLALHAFMLALHAPAFALHATADAEHAPTLALQTTPALHAPTLRLQNTAALHTGIPRLQAIIADIGFASPISPSFPLTLRVFFTFPGSLLTSKRGDSHGCTFDACESIIWLFEPN